MSEGVRRFPIGLTVAVAVALAILVGLGVWQLERLAWKRDLLARIAAMQAAPAAPLPEVLARAAKGEDVAFARVVALCPGLAAAPYAELYALHEGQAGSRLISACRLEGGAYGSILVDRGFVQDIISARPAQDPADIRPTGVRGILRAPDEPSSFAPANTPGRFYGRQIAPLAAALKAADPAPWFLMAETSTNPEWLALKPAPLPAQISNRHLEYALTWFGLAAALLAVYAAMLRGRFKR